MKKRNEKFFAGKTWEQVFKELNFTKHYEKLCKTLSDKKVLFYGAGLMFDYFSKNYDLSKLNIIGIADKKFEINNNKEIILDGMFISIGLVPESNFIKNLIKVNNYNYIESDNSCNTNIEGIFVAGDVRSKKVRQLTTAVNDGTIAAIEAMEYIDNLK